MPTPQLVRVTYRDQAKNIFLECYADAIAYQKTKGGELELAAIRFGGYPEQVRAMSDAIYGGGDLHLEWKDDTFSVRTCQKQYQKNLSMDGLYAEALLYLKDDPQIVVSQEEQPGQTKMAASRNCYILTPADDPDRLFEEIDLRTGVPLIPAFQNYFLSELMQRGFLSKYSVFSLNEKFDLWRLSLTENEQNLIDVVNEGVAGGQLIIPGATPENSAVFEKIDTLTQYLHEFGVTIAERIKDQFNPLFDPAKEPVSQEIMEINENIRRNCGYSLFDAQLAGCEAVKRRLNQHKPGVFVAECGIGKTKMGITALCGSHRSAGKSKTFNVVLCPGHVTKKWVREIMESVPNTNAAVIQSINELKKFYRAYERGSKTAFAVISKERARDGYSRYPSAVWSQTQKAFLCPQCGQPILVRVTEDGVSYDSPAAAVDFLRENNRNHKCGYCGSVLWAPLEPTMQTDWAKVGGFGFVHRRFAASYLEKAPSGKVYEQVLEICRNPNAFYPNTGAVRRFPLSSYIKRKMKGRIDGAIIDELHNYNNDSGQGDAMAELARAADKVIGMTATLVNGYASGIFHLLYRLVPDLMELDGQKHSSPSAFAAEYGVTESVYETTAAEYNANRRSSRRKVRERQLPGVSPLVYSRFLLETAVFLSLADVGKALPEYEEIPIELEMREDIRQEYKRLEGEFRDIMRSDRKIAKKIMSAYMGLLTVYPDQPYDLEPIRHPLNKEWELSVPASLSTIEEEHQKELRLMELVDRKMAKAERVLIYTSWVRIDTQEKLLKLFAARGYPAAALTVAVSPQKREEWVEKQLRAGIKILIVNPSLVETGLDLNAFTTLIYYNIAYNLFTLRQSSRRSWRINQTAPRIEVYFFFYKDTMQARAMRLMASKLMAAGILEGNVTDEGLAAMSDCRDLTTQLAKELTLGIRDEVEDLAAVFKKMAVLKPPEATPEPTETAAVENQPRVFPLRPLSAASVQQEAEQPEPYETPVIVFAVSNNRRRSRKTAAVSDGQLSFFDMTA